MLRQFRIKNFQSVEDLTYNFSDGLNVIIGENNTGKSVLNKAIEVLVNFNSLRASDVEQYITFGKPKSDLIITGDSGCYWVEIYPRKINYYCLENDNFVFVGNELPPGLIKCLDLLVCEGNFVGNLITSNHSKLLVDSSSNINNQILSLIARDDSAENILEECEERLSTMNSNLRTLRINRSSIESELSTIEVEDTTLKEEALSRVFSLTNFVEELIGVKETSDLLKFNVPKVGNMDELINFVSNLETLMYKFDNLRFTKEVKNLDEDIKVVSELESFNDKLDVVLSKMTIMSNIKEVNVDNDLLGVVAKLELLQSNLAKVNNVKKVNDSNLLVAEQLEELLGSVENYYNKAVETERLKSEAKSLLDELNSYGGEEYDCPIYGTIKYINDECIHISK